MQIKPIEIKKQSKSVKQHRLWEHIGSNDMICVVVGLLLEPILTVLDNWMDRSCYTAPLHMFCRFFPQRSTPFHFLDYNLCCRHWAFPLTTCVLLSRAFGHLSADAFQPVGCKYTKSVITLLLISFPLNYSCTIPVTYGLFIIQLHLWKVTHFHLW